MKPLLAAVALATGVVITAVWFALWPNPALSQMTGQIPCGQSDPSEHFLNEFGETVHAIGTTESGAVLLRVFGNRESGSWTIVLSRAEPPIHCVIAAGQAFNVVPEDEQKIKGTSASYVRP